MMAVLCISNSAVGILTGYIVIECIVHILFTFSLRLKKAYFFLFSLVIIFVCQLLCKEMQNMES